MDVFKIDQSLSGNLGSAPSPDKITPEVSFDAGSEFNLSFFDTPEDSSTQGFSDPGSVGSTSASSPPPQQLTPLHLPLPGGSSAPNTPLLLSPPGAGASSSTVTVKQGIPLRLVAFLGYGGIEGGSPRYSTLIPKVILNIPGPCSANLT